MGMPRHPNEDDDAVAVNKASIGRTRAVITVVVVALLIIFIALHLAGVYGP